VNFDFWTAVGWAVLLGMGASGVYIALDMIFKQGCFSAPCGLKYGTMLARLVLFSSSYTLGVGAASFAAASSRLAMQGASGYSFRLGLAAGFFSCVTIVVRRVLYERANYNQFAPLDRPDDNQAHEKDVPPLFGMKLWLSFNRLLDEFEESAVFRVREQLVDRGYDQAKAFVEKVGDEAPAHLVDHFLQTHVLGNGKYTEARVAEIKAKLQARTTEAGFDSLARTLYVMGDIRYFGYQDYLRKRNFKRVAELYGS